MRTAIFIEDGVTQIVLTPTTDFEKKTLLPLAKEGLSAEVTKGSFYRCQGGHVRQGSDESLILEVQND